jgi:molybdopterin-guanine dinucleotide biosynthesis adapter protein
MRIFSVFGITKSGKTTTAENLIRELRQRRFSVGSIKDIHFEAFAIDTEGTNTYRHKAAGSQLVTARGIHETDFLFPEALPLEKILSAYDQDFVVMEGVEDTCAPKIVTAHNTEEVDERLDETVFAISGVLSNSLTEYRGLPVLHPERDIDRLVDLVEEKVFPRLPDMDPACCQACGYSCHSLTGRILRGESRRADCVLDQTPIQLKIDGQDITMVPFVQTLLKNALLGVVKELEGYRKHGQVQVTILGDGND